MPRRRRAQVVLTNQQAQGLFSSLAKKAVKAALPLVKREVKKQVKKQGSKLAKKAGKAALARARRTKAGRRLGIGLRLAGQGPRDKQRRRRGRIKRGSPVRVIMV